MNANSLKILLLFFFISMYLITLSYLRQRKMKPVAYAVWGTFALLLPGFGPFFVIAYRPGEWDKQKRSNRVRARRNHSKKKK
jgi:peptidoglycan/LPS O-acetylase OafA/YrhL